MSVQYFSLCSSVLNSLSMAQRGIAYIELNSLKSSIDHVKGVNYSLSLLVTVDVHIRISQYYAISLRRFNFVPNCLLSLCMAQRGNACIELNSSIRSSLDYVKGVNYSLTANRKVISCTETIIFHLSYFPLLFRATSCS